MLIGNTAKRPSLHAVRKLKRVLGEALDLPEGAMVTVTQLACLEVDCAPLETVVGLLRPGTAQLQHKIHKATDAIDARDLVEVCQSWGRAVPLSTLETLMKES